MLGTPKSLQNWDVGRTIPLRIHERARHGGATRHPTPGPSPTGLVLYHIFSTHARPPRPPTAGSRGFLSNQGLARSSGLGGGDDLRPSQPRRPTLPRSQGRGRRVDRLHLPGKPVGGPAGVAPLAGAGVADLPGRLSPHAPGSGANGVGAGGVSL